MAKFGPENFTAKDGRTIVLRHCTPADAPLLNAFQAQIARETVFTNQFAGQEEKSVEKVVEVWKEAETAPRPLYLGAFCGGVLVGQLAVRVNNPNHPWGKHLAYFGMMVLKDYWGCGLGRRLVEIMETFATRSGITRIEAHVRASNARGLKFYERAGFRIEGTRRAAALIDGIYEDEHFIAKLIGDAVPSWRPPSLETERLILRAVTEADAPAILEYASNPKVARLTAWEPHRTLDDTFQFIHEYVAGRYALKVPEPLVITQKDNPGKTIGTVGCFWASEKNKTMELAYALSEPFWGRGLVVEAARAVVDHVFRNYDVNRVQAHCKAENLASARVMEKLGMKYEGTVRSGVILKGQVWDMKYYAVLREEWN